MHQAGPSFTNLSSPEKGGAEALSSLLVFPEETPYHPPSIAAEAQLQV